VDQFYTDSRPQPDSIAALSLVGTAVAIFIAS